MTTPITITPAHNESRLAGTLDFLNLGAGVVRVRVYEGTRPTLASDPPTGSTLLVECEMDDPPGTIAANALTCTPGPEGIAVASGTAQWCRFVNGNGDAAIDSSVSDSLGDEPVKLSTVAILAGGGVRVLSAVFS